MVPVAINGRWTVKLPDFRAKRVEWPWWEATRLAAMRAFLSPGDVVFDVGTEEGDLSALWAAWGCLVALCEPNPRAWPCIRSIFQANDLEERVLATWPGFIVDGGRAAAGAEAGVLPRGVWPEASLGAMEEAHGFVELRHHGDIPGITIDTLTAVVGPPRVITMDIEGAEVLAIPGAAGTLRDHRPDVFVSIHPRLCLDLYGLGNATVFQTMEECGYEELYLGTDHEEHWLFTPKERPWHRR